MSRQLRWLIILIVLVLIALVVTLSGIDAGFAAPPFDLTRDAEPATITPVPTGTIPPVTPTPFPNSLWRFPMVYGFVVETGRE